MFIILMTTMDYQVFFAGNGGTFTPDAREAHVFDRTRSVDDAIATVRAIGVNHLLRTVQAIRL